MLGAKITHLLFYSIHEGVFRFLCQGYFLGLFVDHQTSKRAKVYREVEGLGWSKSSYFLDFIVCCVDLGKRSYFFQLRQNFEQSLQRSRLLFDLGIRWFCVSRYPVRSLSRGAQNSISTPGSRFRIFSCSWVEKLLKSSFL